jgi:hypothetical protein
MACAVLCGASVMASPGLPPILGPDWEEGTGDTGDAGSTPGSAQTPSGTPLSPLNRITGSLTGFPSVAGDVGDFQDMYFIFITGPSLLSVSTSPDKGGNVDFAAQLWLFDSEGLGLLGTANSTFNEESNDGSGVLINEPGLYYICITGLGSVPFDQFENPLFNFTFDGEISGPDGPGGENPISFWGFSESKGNYELALEGIGFAPAPGSAVLLMAAMAMGRRRRR